MSDNVTRNTIHALGGPWTAEKSTSPDLPNAAVVRDEQGWSVAYLTGVDPNGRPRYERLGAVAALPVLVDTLFKIASTEYRASSAYLIDEARLAMRYLAEKIEESRKVAPLV